MQKLNPHPLKFVELVEPREVVNVDDLVRPFVGARGFYDGANDVDVEHRQPQALPQHLANSLWQPIWRVERACNNKHTHHIQVFYLRQTETC